MIASLDIHRAVVKLWDDNLLDDHFKANWTADQASKFVVLLDTESSPNQPWPYAVFDIPRSNVVTRQTGGMGDARQKELRNIPLTFNIHARNSGTKSAKQIAGDLAEQVMAIYGGHPTTKAKDLELTHGGVLLCQYGTDYGVKTGDEEHQWVVEYSILADVPVKI